MSQVTISQLHKTFGQTPVIQGVDLTVNGGEFMALVGPSGCGKSTLLRLIAGLEDADRGSIKIGKRDVSEVAACDRKVAMVFQSYALYPHMTVAENIGFGLRMNGVSKLLVREKTAEVAEILQIEELLERKPKQLSGGQKQRVAIGRAIIRDPQVFLFDEPLSNLDAELRVEMRHQIIRLHKRMPHTTMIYVTHDQMEAMTMADKIAVLRSGRIEQVGPPLELYHQPKNSFVAGFIGSPKMNFLQGTLVNSTLCQGHIMLKNGQQLTSSQDTSAWQQDQPLMVGYRPEHVIIQEDGPFQMTIQVAENLGTNSYLYGAFSGQDSFTIEASGAHSYRAGDTVRFQMNPQQVHLFPRAAHS